MICSRWTVSNLLELLDPSMTFKSKSNIYKIFHEEKQEKAETVPKNPKQDNNQKKDLPQNSIYPSKHHQINFPFQNEYS